MFIWLRCLVFSLGDCIFLVYILFIRNINIYIALVSNNKVWPVCIRCDQDVCRLKIMIILPYIRIRNYAYTLHLPWNRRFIYVRVVRANSHCRACDLHNLWSGRMFVMPWTFLPVLVCNTNERRCLLIAHSFWFWGIFVRNFLGNFALKIHCAA